MFQCKSIYFEDFPQYKHPKYKNSNFYFKSRHLETNPGQGPVFKCAPGHKSMEDFYIIKSYWPKSGVVQIQNRHVSCLHLFCSKSTAMNAMTAFPGNSFLAFNQSPILQVSRIGYMPEMGFSWYPVNEFIGHSVVSWEHRRMKLAIEDC